MSRMTNGRDAQKSIEPQMFSVEANDSKSELIDRAGIDPAVVSHISEVMAALGRLREAERKLSHDSQHYMKLNENDMRALHFLMVCENQGVIATPSAIAAHLRISAASTTKLLDRLEAGGHIARHSHPTDRRAYGVTVTVTTRDAAMNSVGRQQARRFHAAARLTPEQRDVVIGFLDDMARELASGNEWTQSPATAAGTDPLSDGAHTSAAS